MNISQLTENQEVQAQQYNGLDEVISEIDFDHFLSKRFGPWNPYWFVHDYVRQYFSHPEQKLLSFGCGTGGDALRYARMGYQVYGFDISSRRINIAKALAKKYGYEDKVTFSVQVAEHLDYPSDYFDIVVGVNILHHIDVERSAKEILRVLKEAGLAIFKEPLRTPVRDRIRNSILVTWLLPKGTKNVLKKLKYRPTQGEQMLDDRDFALLRRYFSKLTIERWRVLALLSVLVANRPFLEKCDWLLFRLVPFIRRFGDQAVLIVENE